MYVDLRGNCNIYSILLKFGWQFAKISWNLKRLSPQSQLAHLWPVASDHRMSPLITRSKVRKNRIICLSGPSKLRSVFIGSDAGKKFYFLFLFFWVGLCKKCVLKGHFTHETESPWWVHFKHSHWWKRRSQSKFASHSLCSRDQRSEYVNARWMWSPMDHVSWLLRLFSKSTSWR
jgi:hypothetical protein